MDASVKSTISHAGIHQAMVKVIKHLVKSAQYMRLSRDESAGTEQQEQTLDMTENVAYGPLKTHACTDNL